MTLDICRGMVWMDRLGIMTGILIACIGIGLSITPCLAGERYLSGGPDLFVSLGSTSELIPGATAELPVTIGNKGTVTMEIYNYLSMQPMYPPTTAKSTIIETPPRRCPGAGAIQPSDHRGRSSRTDRPCNLHCRHPAGCPGG